MMLPDDFTVCAFEVELLVQQGPSAGERHVLSRFPAFVGRGTDVDVRLMADADDRMLSRKHLKISVEGGRIVVVDLSTNGTWVGQQHLRNGETYSLIGGEPVWLGPKTMIELRPLGAAMAPTAATAAPPVAAAAPPRPVPIVATEGAIELEIEVLGNIKVQAGDQELKVWAARKAMVLLACLADGPPGRTVSPERLTDLLWPDGLADAKAALQATVSRLRRAFKTADAGLPDPVDLYRGSYRLSPTYNVRFDARQFELLADEATQLVATDKKDEAAAVLERAVALYQGPFLDGFTDDWVDARRRALASRYYDAVDLLAEMREWQGKADQAVRLCEGVLEREPCRERSQIGLMRSLAASGRRDEALRRYEVFIKRLKKEMGLSPGPELVLMHETIKGLATPPEHLGFQG